MLALVAALACAQTLDPTAEVTAAREEAARGDFATARARLDRLVRTFPTWGLAHVELAEVIIRDGRDTEAAFKALSTAQGIEPNNPRVFALQGRLLEDTGNRPAAADAYGRSLALRPAQPEVRLRRGLILSESGDAATAIEDLKIALAASPGESSARAALARLYEAKGDLATAERHLGLLVKANPKNAPYRRRLADVYERQGKRKLAERQRKRADAISGTTQRKLRSLPASKQ